MLQRNPSCSADLFTCTMESLMKALYSFLGSLPFLFAVILLGTATPPMAMPPAAPPSCGCGDLPPDTEQTKVTTVCIDGDTCEVAITYRHYAATPMEVDPCNGSLRINSRTCFKRICFPDSCPLPIGKEQKVMESVFYALNPLGGDINALAGSIPYCDHIPPINQVYCWTVTMPRCVRWEGNCLVLCGDEECCTTSWRICINPVTGQPYAEENGVCPPPNQVCHPPCIPVVCKYDPTLVTSFCR